MPSDYLTFLGLAALVVLAPGPDFAVVTKNCLVYPARGRGPGLATSLGVVTSLLIQGAAAATGVAALVLRSATIFTVLRFVGAVYLGYLGFQAVRSAIAQRNQQPADGAAGAIADNHVAYRRVLGRSYRQGFISNISNPKVLAFYFSLLPQFVDPKGSVLSQVFLLALTHAVLALAWLVCVVAVLDQLRAFFRRPTVHSAIEGLTGLALIGFGVRLLASPHP